VAGPPEQAFGSDVEIVNRPDALPRLADAEPIEPARAEPAPGSVRPVESSAAMERARQAARAEAAAAERARRGLPAAPVPAPDPVQDERAVEPAPERPAERIVAVAPEILVPAPAAPKPAPKAKAAPKPEPAPAREVVEAPAAADIPTFAIEKTQWHPLADRRVAWLRVPGESESRRVVEGDVVEGLLVSKIEPSGVVFERDGKKIERVLGKR
jgi:hypothetical protein